MIIQVIEIHGIVGGGYVLAFTTSDNTPALAAGCTLISVGGLVLVYEIIMIVLSFMEKINHLVRLLVVRHQYDKIIHRQKLSYIWGWRVRTKSSMGHD